MTLRGKRRLMKRLRAKLDTVLVEVVAGAADTVIRRTPVESGAMAANWRVAIGNPDGVTFDFDLTKRDVGGARAGARRAAKKMKAGSVAFIVNASPYGRLVEYGLGQRKPTGMVRVTRSEMPHRLRKAITKALRRTT